MNRAQLLARNFLLSRITVRNVRRHLAKAGLTPPSLAVDFSRTDIMPADLIIERVGAGFNVHYSVDASPIFVGRVQHHLRAYIYWLSLCDAEIRSMSVTGADGNLPSVARFAPSSNRADQIAIPDPHFFDHRGYQLQREFADRASRPWDKRSEELVWRGGANGIGRISFEQSDQYDNTVMARFRLISIMKDVPGADIRLTGMPAGENEYYRIGKALGFIADPISQESWLGRKYAIDIDGTANTWGNLLIRLLYGCCVLKVESQFGFGQWYYDRLRPYEHYVPVKADMSDLVQQWEWAKAHDDDARRIATNGVALAQEISFERGKADAVALISSHWG